MKQKRSKPQPDSLVYRAVELSTRAEGEDAVPLVLATETPVRVFDFAKGRIVDEVLLMSGIEYPRQLPLLESHSRYSTDNLRGSIRSLKVDGDKLVGRAHFGSDEASQKARRMAEEGHLTDVSIGFEPRQVEYLDEGQKRKIKGREYVGPLRLVTRARALEGSLVTIGADPSAKLSPAQRAYFDPDSVRNDNVNEALRALYQKLGMPEGLDDEAALRWAEENLTSRAKVESPVGATPQTQRIDPEAVAADIAAKAFERLHAEQKRRNEERLQIRKLALDAGLRSPDAFSQQLSDEGVSMADACKRILEKQAEERQSLGIHVTRDASEEHRKATFDGLVSRCYQASGLRAPADWKPHAGAKQYSRVRLLDMARQSLEANGVNTRGMDDRDIWRRATAPVDSTRASDGQAYLTTGHFANLLLDATNKTLLKSFEDTILTYQSWVRMAESVPDFKLIYRARLGEVGNQPVVEENGEYKDMSMSDSKESYRVEKRGSLLSFTWEAIKNDDLNGFARAVQLQGAAMKRSINRSVYQILFDNPTLSDTIALFHASSHGANLVASDLSSSVLDTAYSAMMLQTGLNSDVILGIEPKWLIVAPGISATAMVLLNSISDPAVGGSAVGNSNVLNVYGPNGMRRLNLLVEPLLAGNDTDSWYLAADSSQVDTVELTFLQGEESPVFEQETAFVQDAVKYKVRQTWGVAAIDFRGLYKSTGAG